jgi:hypothetical protein
MPQQGGLEMKNRSVLFAGLIALALICMVGITAANETITTTETSAPDTQDTSGINGTDEIPLYNGPIGADSPLYGLKLAWEDLDESFTTNESERIDKQMNHARLRLSEVRRELAGNRTDSAQQAIDLYWQKVNMTQMSLAWFGSNQTGLIHAQEMHTKHQIVLENLMLSHPNNTGLARAYNNSLRLEQTFEEKTQTRFEKIIEKNNKTIFKAYRLEEQEGKRAGNATWNDKGKSFSNVTTAPQVTNGQQDNKDKGHGKPTPTIAVSPNETSPTQEVTSSNHGGQGTDNGQGNGNSNKNDKGNGSPQKK